VTDKEKKRIKTHDANFRALDSFVSKNFPCGGGFRTSIDFTDTEIIIVSTFRGMSHSSEVLAKYKSVSLFDENFNPNDLIQIT
jgi:hypothetical protein